MRILLITPVFHPEPYYLRGLPFARGLVDRGFDVEVLAPFPSYPQGRIFPGYRQRLWQRELQDGVRILRVPTYPSHDASGLRRIATYLSMTASMTMAGPLLATRPDIVHVNQGPATLCLPAECIRLVRGSRILLDVQDLWPESVTDSNMLHSRLATRMLHGWCRHTFRMAHHILALSSGVRNVLVSRGVPESKITVLNNWCAKDLEEPLPARTGGDDPHGLDPTFNVVYTGNLGPLQALDTVLRAAAQIRQTDPHVRFVLVGSGLAEDSLKRQAEEDGLDNVRFIPRQPAAQLPKILAFADAVLVHLRDSPLNRVGIPSKLQHGMAIGRPVLIGAQGSAAELVQAADAGIAFEPENAAALAAAVRTLSNMPGDAREAMGARGRAYYLEKMAFDVGMDKLAELYRRIATPRSPHPEPAP